MHKFSVVVLLAWLLLGNATSHAQLKQKPADIEPEETQPGLEAQYRSLVDPHAMLSRLDPKPTFNLGLSSPHPRLPTGPFEVVWSGQLLIRDSGPISFSAYLCGQIDMQVDGVTVLKGQGDVEASRIEGKSIERPPGYYGLRISYRSLPDRPSRLQIWWQAPSFAREPLPPWNLGHVAAQISPTIKQERLAEQGRALAGQLGCARCHTQGLPDLSDPPPGPSLADIRQRLNKAWLLEWLADPARIRPSARMPALFASDRKGFVERWLVAEYLLGSSSTPKQPKPVGDHRPGRRWFISWGCAACHLMPDGDPSGLPDMQRTPLTDLNDRFTGEELATFLGNPHSRYPDGRMPRLPIAPEIARDMAAFLLLWSKPMQAPTANEAPTAAEIANIARRVGARGNEATGAALVREKRCMACHPGLGSSQPLDIPLHTPSQTHGCLSGKTLPRFQVEEAKRQALAAYLQSAGQDKHPSPFAARQRLLAHHGCVRCHPRDTDRPSPLEVVGSKLGSSMLETVPFQRAPRLTYPHQKYLRSYLNHSVREGVRGLRDGRYTYHMPAFGNTAETLVQALAEADGELLSEPETPARLSADPTLATLAGPSLVGFQGYGCVSCHVWKGQRLSDPDPGAAGTDLTRVAGRIRHKWLERFLEAPSRAHPGTPMPAIFPRQGPIAVQTVLNGEAPRQMEALWNYLVLGKDAPSPKPAPPLPVGTPAANEPVLVAQIPVRMPDGKTRESICILNSSHDLLVYDLGSMTLTNILSGAQLLRNVQGRLRTFSVVGTPIDAKLSEEPSLRLIGPQKSNPSSAFVLHGYDRLPDGIRISAAAHFSAGNVEWIETLRFDRSSRAVIRELRCQQIPLDHEIEVLGQRANSHSVRYPLPAPGTPTSTTVSFSDPLEIRPVQERPGYRAIAYPRPKTTSGEDRIMPSALAIDPSDGRVFVASMKTGELFVLRDPTDDGRSARFDLYAHGLFQEALSMIAEPGSLYVLHRRNLTKITDTDGDGFADRFDRILKLPHSIADGYDYGYGLVRDTQGAFVFTYAPYASTHLPGSGGAIRVAPGKEPQEIAYGFRNPLGWCKSAVGEIYFTDNQGEWVATNKLCHLTPGRFFGFPNGAQRQHASKPRGNTTVWIPYDWAHSINGVTCDTTGGKFGPFAGQFFLAELMFGGGIIRASVENVNGEYQGACFPFWGQGLLGPLVLSFDPRGRLFVGSITEPGWMAQPDRGALFRIDYTGKVPFEMHSISVLPRGFRIRFTAPVSEQTARNADGYSIEHYRYEYTGAYGSPELDRTRVNIERITVAADGRSVDLLTSPLVRDRVYLIKVPGVRSAQGEALVHPMGAYTLNAIPQER